MAKTTLNFTSSGGKYVSEYTGVSGVLCWKREPIGKIHFLMDAGIGYMEMYSTESVKGMFHLNMDGIDKVMIVSDGEVTDCIINEV